MSKRDEALRLCISAMDGLVPQYGEVGTRDVEVAEKRKLWGTALAAAREALADNELERLRALQAAAVMPLIGPLLDAWERCSQDVRGEHPELDKQLRQINRAMADAGDVPVTSEALAEQPAVLTDAEIEAEAEKEIPSWFTEGKVKRFARAILARAIPPGCVVVPVALTEEMHVAAVKASWKATGNDDFPRLVWNAMLAARPGAPK